MTEPINVRPETESHFVETVSDDTHHRLCRTAVSRRGDAAVLRAREHQAEQAISRRVVAAVSANSTVG